MVSAFWDTSALVPLCIPEPKTPTSVRLFSLYNGVAWWGTRTEIVSALTRLRRSGEISEISYIRAKQDAFEVISNLKVLPASPRIEATAILNLERYPLRAADARQLAAALEWCEHRPAGQVFLTADRRLSEAAGQAGFTLEPGLIQP